jgi:hypothetical protein
MTTAKMDCMSAAQIFTAEWRNSNCNGIEVIKGREETIEVFGRSKHGDVRVSAKLRRAVEYARLASD